MGTFLSSPVTPIFKFLWLTSDSSDSFMIYSVKYAGCLQLFGVYAWFENFHKGGCSSCRCNLSFKKAFNPATIISLSPITLSAAILLSSMNQNNVFFPTLFTIPLYYITLQRLASYDNRHLGWSNSLGWGKNRKEHFSCFVMVDSNIFSILTNGTVIL